MSLSSPVQAAPHPWSEEALLTKAELYARQMHSYAHDEWQFVLWSTFVLELLARAVVSATSPALLADPKDPNNALYALGVEIKAPKFTPKSLDISSVLRLIERIQSEFVPELSGFALTHMQRRNEELHCGSSPMVNMASSAWLPSFYRVAEMLLKPLNETLQSFLGKEIATSAQEMIDAALDDSAKAVQQAIHQHAANWAAQDEAERLKQSSLAVTWATRQVGHRVDCPACSSTAIVSGRPIAAPIKTINEGEITEIQQYLPARFECIACNLKISGLPQLNASGLGDTYKATFTYDAVDYFTPDDPYAGWEPDFNEP